MPRYNRKLIKRARKLRASMTDSERRLWSHLRLGQIQGVRFYRQRPLAGYIVDFYAPAPKLIIEVDGSQHYEEESIIGDRVRDAYFAEHGYTVLRFSNLEVLQRTEGVLEVIRQAVDESIAG